MKNSQHYSLIAKQYCIEHNTNMVTRGNLNQIEDLLDLFDSTARDRLLNSSIYKGEVCYGTYTTKKAQFVLNKLDKESRKPDAIFRKFYICYNGIINRPTRGFELKEEVTDAN